MIEKRVSNKSQNTMGERTYKIDFNAIFSKVGGVITVHALDMQNIIFYPNGYMNINMNGEYTKHYYADALRIASKIGSGAQGLDLCNDAIVANNHYFTYDYLNERIMQQHDIMREELNEVVVPLQDIQNINPMPHPNFCSLGIGGYEPALFFYHPDHLGSTGMVTDNNATVTQGFLYAPFGEILTEYNPSWQNGQVPKYSFNAKELDEENGMYYYSARYYAPPTFISRDPLFEKYPFMSPYAYCANNPVLFVDPTGMVYGDYYSRTGEWLGNDGIDDNKIYLQDDNGTTFYTPTGTSFTEVGGLIIQNRIEEGADYTISEFKTVGGEISVSGYMLEPAGPSTTVANQDKRIPEGVYDVDSYSSAKFPDNFILSNEDVSKDRKILYHTGNTGSETSGCNLPGSSKGEGRVNGSKDKMSQLRSFIHSVGNLVNSNSNGNKIVKTIINNSIED